MNATSINILCRCVETVLWEAWVCFPSPLSCLSCKILSSFIYLRVLIHEKAKKKKSKILKISTLCVSLAHRAFHTVILYNLLSITSYSCSLPQPCISSLFATCHEPDRQQTLMPLCLCSWLPSAYNIFPPFYP